MIRVFKIGGDIIDNETIIKKIEETKGRKIVVHGGGKAATLLATKLGVETKMVDGRRVTDSETIDIVTMVYAGLINKKIVSRISNGWGFCGADARMMISTKRDGYVGDPVIFNSSLIKKIVDEGYTPVFAPITISEDGELLNTNADSVAQTIAVGLSAIEEVELIYLFEKRGVLKNLADDDSVIERITNPDEVKNFISGGMYPKIENAFLAIAQGVKYVYIGETKIG